MIEVDVEALVKLKDQQTLEEAYKELGRFPESVDYKVLAVTDYVLDDGTRYVVLQLDKENLYVILKVANDGEYYAIMCVTPDAFRLGPGGEFTGGNRNDIIEAGLSFIFKEPADVTNFNVNELEYSDEILNDAEGDGELSYVPLHPTLYGTSSENKLFGITHYRANEACENTEFIILEHGDINGPAGGYITAFHGAILKDGEFEVIR